MGNLGGAAALTTIAFAVAATAAVLALAFFLAALRPRRPRPALWPPTEQTRLLAMLDAPAPDRSLPAAIELLRSDPTVAVPEVVQRLQLRPDWPRGLLLQAFIEAGADRVGPVLLQALERAESSARAAAMFLLASVAPAQAQAALPRWLHEGASVEQLLATLKQVESHILLPQVRPLCAHPAWEVRTQAAVVIGRLGDAADRDRLLAMLGDRFWWVRYRAAHALLALRLVPSEALPTLVDSLEDRFARDILRQAAAEQDIWPETPS